MVEARDAAKHPVMQKTGATTKNSLARNVNGANVEKFLY